MLGYIVYSIKYQAGIGLFALVMFEFCGIEESVVHAHMMFDNGVVLVTSMLAQSHTSQWCCACYLYDTSVTYISVAVKGLSVLYKNISNIHM